jgi:rhodanese-related sulfurtransferase/GNAT superfamily N-acetyltransferase
MRIRPLEPSDAERCDAIIASLPDWFGNEQGIRDCAAAVRSQPGFVLEQADTVSGFVTVGRPRPQVAEITWIAVHPDSRRRGAGRALLDAVVAELQRDGSRYLVVKTLSDREAYEPYAETRAFYIATGFIPLIDLDIWGPENPALLFVRSIAVPKGNDGAQPAPSVEDLLVAARAGAERLTPDEAFHELRETAGALLIDQRTLEQRRANGDLPGAHTMSMTVVPWRLDPQSPWKLPEVTDHDTRVILLCQEGYSSSLSASWLRGLGMRRVADVEGGFEAWRDAELPIEPLAD